MQTPRAWLSVTVSSRPSPRAPSHRGRPPGNHVMGAECDRVPAEADPFRGTQGTVT